MFLLFKDIWNSWMDINKCTDKTYINSKCLMHMYIVFNVDNVFISSTAIDRTFDKLFLVLFVSSLLFLTGVFFSAFLRCIVYLLIFQFQIWASNVPPDKLIKYIRWIQQYINPLCKRSLQLLLPCKMCIIILGLFIHTFIRLLYIKFSLSNISELPYFILT